MRVSLSLSFELLALLAGGIEALGLVGEAIGVIRVLCVLGILRLQCRCEWDTLYVRSTTIESQKMV